MAIWQITDDQAGAGRGFGAANECHPSPEKRGWCLWSVGHGDYIKERSKLKFGYIYRTKDHARDNATRQCGL